MFGQRAADFCRFYRHIENSTATMQRNQMARSTGRFLYLPLTTYYTKLTYFEA